MIKPPLAKSCNGFPSTIFAIALLVATLDIRAQTNSVTATNHPVATKPAPLLTGVPRDFMIATNDLARMKDASLQLRSARAQLQRKASERHRIGLPPDPAIADAMQRIDDASKRQGQQTQLQEQKIFHLKEYYKIPITK